MDDSKLTPIIIDLYTGESDMFYCESDKPVVWLFNKDTNLPQNVITGSYIDKYFLKVSNAVPNNTGTYTCIGEVGYTKFRASRELFTISEFPMF